MRLIKPLLLFLISVLIYPALLSQEMKWNSQQNQLSWPAFVKKAESLYPVKFYYNTDSLPGINIMMNDSLPGFLSSLNSILNKNGYQAIDDNNNHIFVIKLDSSYTSITRGFLTASAAPSGNRNTNGKNHGNGYMQTNQVLTNERVNVGRMNNDNKSGAIISGYVKNADDNSPIIGVLVRIEGTNAAVLSDVSGFYSLHVSKGDYELIAGNLETREKRVNIRVLSDGRLDLMLQPKLVTLNAVVISADKEQIVKNTQMGYQRLATKEIREVPVVLGEQDVIKVSLLLPGVQSIGEGSAGINVRGSPGDQNLFIINNIPVYNASHLLGFFSAFNSDAIKDFELYKSNMPANFGGRLSSIFDIRTRQGNQNNFNAQGGISPVTAHLTVEGPIAKKKSSYMIAVRSTYSDWILKKIDDPDISKSKAGFADVITHFAFDVNKNNRINFTSYHSTDRINIINQNRYNYANNGATLSWSHLFREKNNYSLSLIYSQYDFTEKNTETAISAYRDNFRMKHAEIKTGYTLRPWENHTISAGLNSVLYQIDQGNFRPLGEMSLLQPVDMENEKALESAVFLSDEWAITKWLSVTGAIRYNYYAYLGPQQSIRYAPDKTKSVQSITDTIAYGNNAIIKTYQAPDLRFSLRLLAGNNISFKFSYTQMQQYLFMLSNTIAISPTDKWKLSDYYVKPMAGDQYSFGIYNTLFGGKINVTSEAYYKTVSNLIEYQNGANLVVNEHPETEIVQGNLEAYGIEFMISKPKGRFNGWLNYTWSKTMVNVKSPYPEEQINNNKPYPSDYDKPHAINMVANFKFSRRFSVSSNVVYSTGRPITYPVGFYNHSDFRIPLYSERNEYRIPDYFRIDLSLKLEGNLLSEKFAHGTWIFSVYNLTGRKNAYSVFYRYEDGTMKGNKLSVFGVPIVSLTYSFKLGNYAN